MPERTPYDYPVAEVVDAQKAGPDRCHSLEPSAGIAMAIALDLCWSIAELADRAQHVLLIRPLANLAKEPADAPMADSLTMAPQCVLQRCHGAVAIRAL